MLDDGSDHIWMRRGRSGCAKVLIGAVAATLVSGGPLAGLGATATAATTGGCSWQTQYGLGGSDRHAPDTDAAYWTTSYRQSAGRGLTITGSFPQSRYMSFALYLAGRLVNGASLFDAEIEPSSGVNPFQFGFAGPGGYTLRIAAGPAPPTPAANTLYTGTSTDAEFTLIYRVYDPLDPPTGGVPLPQTIDTVDGVATTVHQPCVNTVTEASSAPLPAVRVSRSATPAAAPVFRGRAIAPATAPSWEVLSSGSDFPNPDNHYLAAPTTAADGQLVVVQAQMPSFPDTNLGESPWQSGQQVRYWSICEDDGPLASVTACVPDFDAVENGGVATFVISSPANRPLNATAADGVNWLSWGSLPGGLVIYRQMLASSTFQQAIPASTASGPLASVMGTYLPSIAYCSEATFAVTGASGCLSGSP